LSGYHVLAPTGLKILIGYDGTPDAEVAAAFGLCLAEEIRGPTTILGVTPRLEEVAQVRETLEALSLKRSADAHPWLTTRVRQGEVETEILSEAQEGFYEAVILGRSEHQEHKPAGLGSTARGILSVAEVPVLLVQSPTERIKRILICTAAGEPGKSVARFGGRVARNRAAVTVLHVLKPGATSGERAHAKSYLNQAQSFFDALAIQSDLQLQQGAVLEHILGEIERGDYDLIVIGAPAPRARRQFMGTDLATQIIAETSRPVAVVPMHQ
jgi:nucleotide-binding universal stress UspA family protein